MLANTFSGSGLFFLLFYFGKNEFFLWSVLKHCAIDDGQFSSGCFEKAFKDAQFKIGKCGWEAYATTL
jgi:hypothetical protein